MIKRIFAAMLCLVMTIAVFASCAAPKSENDKGAIINMYLSQEIYDFDPAYAYNNDAALKVVDLLFSSLFRIDEKGRLQNELAKSYVIDKVHNTMTITLDEKASWSDGTYISANDVVYTFKRVLTPEFSSEVACLLFDIKNARTVKNATSDLYIDDIGIFPIGEREIEITFEDGFTDYEGFLYNLASPALAPLREDLVVINEGDWAKKPGTMSCSGPFMIRKVSYDAADKGVVLERNPYYFREKDEKIDKSVTPYKIVIDYTKTAEEQYQMFLDGQIFYVGDIALSLRGGDIKDLQLTDALSTATIYLNENVFVGKNIKILDGENVSEPEEEILNDIKYITVTHKLYYTYYNHMTKEAYDEKYNGAPYEEIDSSKKKLTPMYYDVFSENSVRRTEVVDGQTVVYIDKYQEWRYKVEETVNGEKVVKHAVDIPDGYQIFANKDIRKAFSMVLDREAIAQKIVYAKAATAFVPNGIFGEDYNRKTDFRETAGDILDTKAQLNEAKALIPSDIVPADYEIELAVRENDEVHCAIADEVKAAWESLGFRVTINKVITSDNNEIGSTGEVSTDIRDDEFLEMYEAGSYTAIIVDIVASTPSAFSFLAPFATEFAGTAVDMNPNDGDVEHLYEVMGHRSGYKSDAYNEKIEAAFAATDKAERAKYLREAEKILLEDAAIIPVIFNQDAYVVSDELKKVESSFFNSRIFTSTKMKDYQKYLPVEE